MKIKSMVIICSALIYSHMAWSWGDLGHSAVGEIAERNLTPKAKAFVQSIIGIEPLAVSATWPDHVRDDARFKKFDPYHFWDMPEGVSFVDFPEAQRAERDAQTIIAQAPELLTSDKVNIKEKMILLRYFVHVVGDVHQPLHLGNPFDRGANLCDVKLSVDGKLLKLHSVWDSQIVDFIREQSKFTGYFTYNDLVKIVLKDVKAPRKITGEPKQWNDETRKLQSVAYPDAKDGIKTEDRPYCKQVDPVTQKVVNGKYDVTKIPVLDENYKNTAAKVIKKQILLGGLRLAYMLNKMAENYNGPASDEDKIIEETLVKNDLNSNRTPQSQPKK